jgi:hypothetical protein
MPLEIPRCVYVTEFSTEDQLSGKELGSLRSIADVVVDASHHDLIAVSCSGNVLVAWPRDEPQHGSFNFRIKGR